MNSTIYNLKTNLENLIAERRSATIYRYLENFVPDYLRYSPIVDFKAVPKNFDFKKLTGSKVKRLFVEIGTGNGEFLVYLAQKYRKALIIGFEIEKEYYVKAKNNIERNLCLNAKMANAEAFETLSNKFSDQSISKLFINFPDPWPKKKHWRRRFLTAEKLPIILSKLRKGGEITFVTDHMGYADFVEEICKDFQKKELIKFEVSEGVPLEYPETKYFRKWKELGKKDYRTIRIIKS